MPHSPTIRAVEAVPARIEGAREFRISEGATRVHVSVVLRLRTDVDGLEGNAEVVSAPPGKPEEFLEEIVGAIERYVAPALVGVPVRERARAIRAVAAVLKGRVWTKAAVTNALYDLHAKALGVPVADLLGGPLLQRVPVIGPVVGIMAPDAMAAEAAAQASAGYAAIKIKVGETVQRDIERVAAVREAIGDAMALRVDANDHYVAADAISLTRGIERYRPEHMEQPVARHDLLGLAEVRRNVGVPMMTDDMVATPEDAMNVIRLNAADRVKVKVTKHGFDGARAICAMLAVGRTDTRARARVRDGTGGHRRSPVRGVHAGARDALRDRLDGADGEHCGYRRQRPASGARLHRGSNGTRARCADRLAARRRSARGA